ncbi:unnamed protein product, partial [Adineta ricciae]
SGSRNGNGVGSANVRRNGNNYRYRTVNAQSEVDETLFGTPHRVATAARMRAERQYTQDEEHARRAQSCTTRQVGPLKKEYIRHITKDLIRDIIVPEDPTCTSVIINGNTYQRLTQAARSNPRVTREYAVEENKQNQQWLEEELERRKRVMQAYDQQRKKNEPLDDIEQEAKEEAQYLLKRANELRQEQEDEVKHLNEMVLNAKCHAIRDAQLLEKQQIKKELEEENKRLDIMMEIERLNAIKIQEEIEKKRHQQIKEGASMVLKQIEENEKEKVYREDMREQENAAMLESMQKLQEKDWEEYCKRKGVQKKLATELLKANRDIDEQRALRKQQDRQADLAVLEFQKAKAAREAAQEAEAERRRAEKEREVARLRAKQERARDLQADKDALRAKREQERREREWREKEKFEALKKAQTEEEMRLAREWQIKNKEQHLAVEAARERAEFERVLKAQLTQAERERMEEEQRNAKRQRFADDLRSQIVRHEKQKVVDRAEFFEEAVRREEEARLRRVRLDQIKNQKLEELRRAGVPEKYCADIERKINAETNLHKEKTSTVN